MTATAPDWRPQVQRRRHAADQRHVRHQARLVVRGDGDHGRLGGVGRPDTGIDPFTHTHRPGRARHPRPPGREPPPRRHHVRRRQPQEVPGLLHRTRSSSAASTTRPGDFTSTGSERCTPTIRKGQSLTFVNDDALADPASSLQRTSSRPSPNYLTSIFHSVTSCQYPCGLDTGISYPLANGAGNYDSGQLGDGTPGDRAAELEHADEPEARDLHVLLPDPPVHAGRVPGHRASGRCRSRMRGRTVGPRCGSSC